MATYEYQRVTHEPLGPVKQEERDAVYRRLEVYCDQDSWGQHALVDVIQQLSGARIGMSAEGTVSGASDRTATGYALQRVASRRSEPDAVKSPTSRDEGLL
jgi:hypothetical protein